MIKDRDDIKHSVTRRCNARFGSEGQVCNGGCALEEVVGELAVAGQVYRERGARVENSAVVVRGLCKSSALHYAAKHGPLPGINELWKIRCGAIVEGTLIISRNLRNQQYG